MCITLFSYKFLAQFITLNRLNPVMKTTFYLILSLLFISSKSYSQVVHIFGFRRAFYGGAENTQDNKSGKTGGNNVYYVYVSQRDKAVPYHQLWIRQELYDCKAVLNKAFPILLRSGESGILANDTLISSSRDPIFYLELKRATVQPLKSSLKRDVLQNDVLIYYKYKRRDTLAKLNKMTELDPVYAPSALPNRNGMDAPLRQ